MNYARALLCVLAVAGLCPRGALAQDVIGKRKTTIAIEWANYETRRKLYAIDYEKGIPTATLDRIGRELDDIHGVYAAFFRYKPKEKFRVKFLDSPNTYEQEGGDPSHPAHYSPGHRRLVMRQMAFYQLIPTIYHEAFHQYLHTYCDHSVAIPIWFDEGMAVYFEGIQRERNKKEPKLDPHLINFRKIRMVKDAIFSRSAIPLAQLIDADHKTFHKKDKENLYYNQSFSLIYFLMKTSRGKLPKAFIAELKKKKDVAAANAKLFGKKRKNLAKIEKLWKSYVLKLEIPDR